MQASRPRVAIVLKGYPRLSETFIAQEILGLKRLGLPLTLVSLRFPTDDRQHPVHGEIAEIPNYLPEYLYQEPMRVLRSWWLARKMPGYVAARRKFFRDWWRDPTPNRGRRFGQALVLAAEMPGDVGLIYVHFLHTPGSVARYAAEMLGLPFAVSAHAKDIWTLPDWEKREKLADLDWLVTCTAANAEHLQALAPDPARVQLVYHGLDFSRFPPDGAAGTADRDGSDLATPARLLTVGRLVDKKGYRGLFAALALLPAALAWELSIVGGGPLKDELRALAESLGINGKIRWLGTLAQAEILGHYRASDVFALNCRVSDDGDRDGLPNVLMEAQSQGLACVSTKVSAIPELIVDGETGLLVAPNDPAALSAAIACAIGDPALRHRLGEAGRKRVTENFGYSAGVATIFGRITATLEGTPGQRR